MPAPVVFNAPNFDDHVLNDDVPSHNFSLWAHIVTSDFGVPAACANVASISVDAAPDVV